jgi:hypothetical protein
MPYICKCGRKSIINLNNFKTGHRCSGCSGGVRLTYKYVSDQFKAAGYVLLETEYVNASTSMAYRCPLEHEGTITWNNFQQGQRCGECAIQRRGESQRHKIEFVRWLFEQRGCELVSPEYKSCEEPLHYRCKCGKPGKATLDHFLHKRKGKCRRCGQTHRKLIPLDFVRKIFQDGGCILLADSYDNNRTPMRYRCNCGNVAEISLENFKQGKRCWECRSIKISHAKSMEALRPLFPDSINLEEALIWLDLDGGT